jgi:uncharacterized surface protein with fasciclin (FAS1) repeats
MQLRTVARTGGTFVAVTVLGLGLTACGNDDGAGGTDGAPSTSNASSQTFGPGCASVPTSGTGSFDSMASEPIVTAASTNPLLSTLVTAVTKARLLDTLNSANGLTVFAPDNAAFAKIPAAALKLILDNRTLLTEILTHHLVAGELDPAELVGTQITLDHDTVAVKGDINGMTVDGANVVCGNMATANATVYIIDTVLMPKKT